MWIIKGERGVFMELYEQILDSKDAISLAHTNKSILKKQQKQLHKTITGMMMTMQYGDITYEREISLLEEKLDKIDTCLALTHKK